MVSRLLNKSSRDAAQGENERESAVYTVDHEPMYTLWEPDFDAAMRPSGVFQQPASGRQSGVAIIMVLWGTALLVALVLGTVALVRGQVSGARHSVQAVQARALAEAGIDRAIAELLLVHESTRWRADGSAHLWALAEGSIVVSIQDVSGLIDLSTAREEFIDGVLRVAGTTASERPGLRDAILDWRDGDNLRRLHGAEDDDYASGGYDYGAKDAPFDSIEELRQVSGMDEKTYERLVPLVTIYSGATGINPMMAPEAVIRSLPGLGDGTIHNYVAVRASLPPGVQAAPLAGVDAQLLSQSAGTAYRIRSEATGQEGSMVAITATIRLTPAAERPYTVLSWRE